MSRTAGQSSQVEGLPLPSDLPAIYAALLEAIGDSVIITDRIRSWNTGAAATFGYTAEEMIGRTPALLYPEEAAERLAVDLQPWRELSPEPDLIFGSSSSPALPPTRWSAWACSRPGVRSSLSRSRRSCWWSG